MFADVSKGEDDNDFALILQKMTMFQ
jgi:hypothetical protein